MGKIHVIRITGKDIVISHSVEEVDGDNQESVAVYANGVYSYGNLVAYENPVDIDSTTVNQASGGLGKYRVLTPAYTRAAPKSGAHIYDTNYVGEILSPIAIVDDDTNKNYGKWMMLEKMLDGKKTKVFVALHLHGVTYAEKA